jgi:hypothetical protein
VVFATSPLQSSKKQVERYGSMFQLAYDSSGRACLCGVLAGEAGLLPERLQVELGKFIDGNPSSRSPHTGWRSIRPRSWSDGQIRSFWRSELTIPGLPPGLTILLNPERGPQRTLY